jgi:hypothetical protein
LPEIKIILSKKIYVKEEGFLSQIMKVFESISILLAKSQPVGGQAYEF